MAAQILTAHSRRKRSRRF